MEYLEIVYSFVKANSKLVTWSFGIIIGIINGIWVIFTYLNNKKHDKKIEEIKHSLNKKLKTHALKLYQNQKEIDDIFNLISVVTEAKHLYLRCDGKKLSFPKTRKEIDSIDKKLAGFSKYPTLQKTFDSFFSACNSLICEEYQVYKNPDYKNSDIIFYCKQIQSSYDGLIDECRKFQQELTDI